MRGAVKGACLRESDFIRESDNRLVSQTNRQLKLNHSKIQADPGVDKHLEGFRSDGVRLQKRLRTWASQGPQWELKPASSAP